MVEEGWQQQAGQQYAEPAAAEKQRYRSGVQRRIAAEETCCERSARDEHWGPADAGQQPPDRENPDIVADPRHDQRKRREDHARRRTDRGIPEDGGSWRASPQTRENSRARWRYLSSPPRCRSSAGPTLIAGKIKSIGEATVTARHSRAQRKAERDRPSSAHPRAGAKMRSKSLPVRPQAFAPAPAERRDVGAKSKRARGPQTTMNFALDERASHNRHILGSFAGPRTSGPPARKFGIMQATMRAAARLWSP